MDDKTESTTPKCVKAEHDRLRRRLFKELAGQLQSVIYLELIILYYLDNSSVSFFARCVSYAWLSGASASTYMISQPYSVLGILFSSNLGALMFHLFRAAPHGGDDSRGYLAGTLMLDLVGQKGPSSKLRLMLLDTLITVAQLLHVSISQQTRDSNVIDELLRKQRQSEPTFQGDVDMEPGDAGVMDDEQKANQPTSPGLKLRSMPDAYFRAETLGTLWLLDFQTIRRIQDYVTRINVKSSVLQLDREERDRNQSNAPFGS